MGRRTEISLLAHVIRQQRAAEQARRQQRDAEQTRQREAAQVKGFAAGNRTQQQHHERGWDSGR